MANPRTDRVRSVATAAALAALLMTGGAAVRSDANAADTGRPCHVRGLSEQARCHTVTVPENREIEGGRTIGLHVAVLPSRAARPAETPLFLLAGGPGQAATEVGGVLSGFLEGVRETRDIVLMDQRGTGRSAPLACRDANPSLDRSTGIDDLVAAIRACRATWDADLAHYSTLEVVADIEAVRQALGYPRLDLWGASWGTRTALLYMRAHAQRVRSAVLDGVTAPDRRLLLDEPAASQAALDSTLAACAADAGCAAAFPGLGARFATWLDGMTTPRPFDAIRPDTGRAGQVTLGRDGIVQMLRAALYSPDGAARLPFAVDRLLAGDATVLATMAWNGLGLADSMYTGATLAGLCREELPRTPPDAIAAAASAGFTGSSWYRIWSGACAGVPVRPLPGGYDAPVTADVPVLILSGGLDPVTPPANGEAAARHLPNSRHLVAPSAGHNVTVFPCVDKLVAKFVQAADVSGLDVSCLEKVGRPPFVTGPAGPLP